MIYHITKKSDWLSAKSAESYAPESLQTEGFVRCVDEQRFEQVANFYFKDHKDLVVLEIDPEKLTAEVKIEMVGSYTFPHIYGQVILSAVARVADLAPNQQGLFEFPFKRVLH